MKHTQLIDRFQQAKNNKAVVVIEGVQALKHAVRFEAEFEQIVTPDIELITNLLKELAPDTLQKVTQHITCVDDTVFSKLSTRPHRTKVIALAKQRSYKLTDIDPKKPIVYLEEPKDLENIGAVIRVAAGANAGAVCISGSANIWHPAVIRGAAGLHFALPVMNATLELLESLSRPLISLDPTGEEVLFSDSLLQAILIFGTERHGINPQTLGKSDTIIRLPMKLGVSSLNLATSVAATLYRIP